LFIKVSLAFITFYDDKEYLKKKRLSNLIIFMGFTTQEKMGSSSGFSYGEFAHFSNLNKKRGL